MKRPAFLRYSTPLLYQSAMEVARDRNREKRAPWVFLGLCVLCLITFAGVVKWVSLQEAEITAWKARKAQNSREAAKTRPGASHKQETPAGIIVTKTESGVKFNF